jgi:hypothetical protein
MLFCPNACTTAVAVMTLQRPEARRARVMVSRTCRVEHEHLVRMKGGGVQGKGQREWSLPRFIRTWALSTPYCPMLYCS